MGEFNIETKKETKTITYHSAVINGVEFDNAETLFEILENLMDGDELVLHNENIEEGLLELSLIEGGYFGGHRINNDKKEEVEELVDELFDVVC